MELHEFLKHIESLHFKSIDLGLDRIRAVAEKFIPLSFKCPVVTISGTNGKGTTVAVIAALAQHAGLKVATYTSPHLYRFNERIQINGVEITDQDLLEAFNAVEQARGDITLTYFEFITLAALYYFHEQQPDLVILEVGMGGRLDATNLIDADIAIITSIGLDHMSYLGDTKEAIALEKAGIMRPGKPVICGDLPMQTLLRAHAQEINAEFYGLLNEFEFVKNLKTNLVPSNIACAVKAAELIGLVGNFPSEIIENVQIPGRKQHLMINNKNVLLDVAHNEDSLNELVQYLLGLEYTRIHLVLGVMGDKEFGEPLQDLLERCSSIHLAAPNTPRAMPADVLMDSIDAESQIYPSVSAAFVSALAHCGPNDCVVVTGSFYTISECNQVSY